MKKIMKVYLSIFILGIVFNTVSYAQQELYSVEVEKAYENRTENEKKIATDLFYTITRMNIAISKGKSPEEAMNLYTSKSSFIDTQGRHRILIRFKTSDQVDIDKVRKQILDNGGAIHSEAKPGHNGYVEIYAWVSFNKIVEISQNPSVGYIDRLSKPLTRYTTEGDVQLRANAVRTTMNVTGEWFDDGVLNKIGVMSNGIDSYIDGSLPITELPFVTSLDDGGGNEGTAMLEIIYDLAPGAHLYFSTLNGYGGNLQFRADKITQLKNYGCKIIVDDIYNLREPFFSDDHVLGEAIRDFIADGNVYITAAGNDRKQCLSGKTYFQNEFLIFPDGRNYFPITITDEDDEIVLQWATDWNFPTTDLDIYFEDATGDIKFKSERRQSALVPPYELTDITPGNYILRVKRYNNNCPDGVDFKILTAYSDYLNVSMDNQIYSIAAYPNVISVAAYDASDLSKTADYSSIGPAYIYSASSQQWTTQSVPTITATAGVVTYVGKEGLWPDGYPFYGTSASAPHVAGLAALYFHKLNYVDDLNKTNYDFYNSLTQSASSIGSGTTGGVWNKTSGYGKADIFAAIAPSNKVATPTFSKESGQYAPFSLVISCATVGSEIRYTLDGSSPSQTSLLYSNPIPISSNKTVKAIAYKSGLNSSDIKIATYQIFNNYFTLRQLDAGGLYYGEAEYYYPAEGGWIPVAPNTPVQVTPGTTQSFRAYQGVIPNTTQKFLMWHYNEMVISEPLNWFDYTMAIGSNAFKARFYHTKNAVVSNAIEGFNLTAMEEYGNVSFLDPWFINDYSYTGGKGPRNKGFSAIPVEFGSPLSITISSPLKGVFLNQSGPSTNWTKPYYAVKSVESQNINLGGTLGVKKFYFQDWSATPEGDAWFKDNTLLETPVQFRKTDVHVQANLKGIGLSNDPAAYQNNNQRKFVRTSDGYLHHVYQSMNKVWYEVCPLNGTWGLMNAGKSLSNGKAKNPSIDVHFDYSQGSFLGLQTVITWQEENPNGGYSIKMATFGSSDYNVKLGDFVISTEEMDYSTNSEPVLVWDQNSNFMIIWKGLTLDPVFNTPVIGFKYRSGVLSNNSFLLKSEGLITGTNELSYNPTLSLNRKYPYDEKPVYHFAWSQDESTINYCRLRVNLDFTVTQYSPVINQPFKNLSEYSGYNKNYIPTMAILQDDLARIAWIGERPDDKRLLFRGINNDRNYWVYGSSLTSGLIQNTLDNNYYLMWCGTGGTSLASNYTQLTTIKNISGSGNQVDVAMGESKLNTFGMIFNNNATPFYFTKTNNSLDYYFNQNEQLEKGSLVSMLSAGREGLLTKDSLAFYYTLGDVTLNGELVNFKKITDSTNINSNEEVLGYLETEPIELLNNSILNYSVQYGVKDYMANLLVEDQFVNFKVSLVDVQTNEIIAVFDNITYSAENLLPYSNTAYTVNTSMLGNRIVKLALKINDNINGFYSVGDIYDISSILPKMERKELNIFENMQVSNYEIFQNYPNPFNPSTTIRYQIPEDGMVSLKIYDILGKEVKTLVNGFKSKGRYEVTFDASNLSSGLYIYEIVSGSYKASKKMTLLK